MIVRDPLSSLLLVDHHVTVLPHISIAARLGQFLQTVTTLIMKGMFILIPAMTIAGGSGMAMSRKRKDALARAKKTRKPIIALNGLLILVPAAWFLAGKAAASEFDSTFYMVQVVEWIAGAANHHDDGTEHS